MSRALNVRGIHSLAGNKINDCLQCRFPAVEKAYELAYLANVELSVELATEHTLIQLLVSKTKKFLHCHNACRLVVSLVRVEQSKVNTYVSPVVLHYVKTPVPQACEPQGSETYKVCLKIIFCFLVAASSVPEARNASVTPSLVVHMEHVDIRVFVGNGTAHCALVASC